jgi:type IV pilus assembly protein PilE
MRGFTLIEIIIAVAIVGILAAIALPSYQRYVVRSNRADSQQALLQMSMQAERYFTAQNSYVSSAALTAFLQSNITAAQRNGIYTYAVAVPSGNMSFTITATPVASRSNAADGALVIGSDGTRTRGGSYTWTDR